MIIDKIENAHLYKNISERISKSFEYIKATDLITLPTAKYPIDGDNIFALISEYKTKPESEGKLEAHRTYIDVQYVIRGEELMGYAPLGNQKIIVSYKEENDIVFFTGDKSFVKVSEGMFAIFFPEDVHMPGIMTEESSPVKKLVIKCLV